MFTFETSGFDEIERKLQQLAAKAEAMAGEHARRERPDARHLLPLSSYSHTLESDGGARRERQIVQSKLNLVEFSP